METERDNITRNFTTGMAWENPFQVLLHLHAKSIIQRQLSLRKKKKLSSTSFQSLKKSLLFSFYLLMVPLERPRALQIMGKESLSASGVDVSHDVEQKALLSLRLHMNILETTERPAEKMSAE